MKKRVSLYIVLTIILFSSTVFGVMLNENKEASLNMEVLQGQKVIDNTSIIEESTRQLKIDYIKGLTKLNNVQSEFLLKQCDEKELDVFLVLGLMKVESNFNTKLVGSLGERGLGQLMDGTARTLARNLNKKYDPSYLFKPEYNIELFTTHLKYLKGYYNGNVHKILTAYNRGQYGLKKYMASRSSTRNPESSIYSNRVIEYKIKFKRAFENFIDSQK
ncbi:lytic transglycosylase domain-containing protein [Clostridiisalibacter paucivorans]|uniref:lytic transglycosylase domain-containing protein n=1 Tax=Clostridiisalibacter paucivorans TaxID=408753 RepID=UPI0004792D27|nr:lytic transglycosylase domain-containing protein [Clostridiisalibacter paucivorans]